MIIGDCDMKKYAFFAVNDTYFTRQMSNYNCKVYQMYKKIPSLLKVLRKLHYKLGFPFFKVWLNNIPNQVNDLDYCIVYASRYSAIYVKYLRKKTNAKIIFWYNNLIITDGCFHKTISAENFSLASFDKKECTEYKMQYNSQYYFSSIILPNNAIQYDVLFIGKDKGRYRVLENLENYLKNMGLRTCFYICSNNAERGKSNQNGKYKPFLQYEEVLEYISKSKVIVDINQEDQLGMTLRPLEALFLQKKIITTNKSIMNELLYNENNICIIEANSPNIQRQFFETPYEVLADDIIDYYDFNSWLKRFK